MNPYTRFTTVSTLMAATVTVGAVLAFGMPAFDAISHFNGADTGPGLMAATGAGLALLVVGWLGMTDIIFPLIFRMSAVRKMVLGKYYIEGTWLQAERGQDEKRMSVIDIQPDGNRFIFSGYSLNEDLEIESNIMIEFSRFEWPFMVYKYRNSLSDGSDGRRDGVGEIQLEMNRSSARRYNGFLQYVKSDERLKIEGAKLVNAAEVNHLRSLDGRQVVFEKYWKLFFHRAMRPGAAMWKSYSETQAGNGEHDLAAHANTPIATKAKPQEPARAAPDALQPDALQDVRAIFEPAVSKVEARLQAMHPAHASTPELVKATAPVFIDDTLLDRREPGLRTSPAGSDGVVPRRRASDWSKQASVTRASEANGRPIIRTRYSSQSLNGTGD